MPRRLTCRLLLGGLLGAGLLMPAAAAAQLPVPATPYAELFIVRPRAGETVHSNDGLVQVQVVLDPVLQASADHRFRALLDGQLWPAAWVAQTLNLRDVARGTHRLQVIVTDAAGRQLAASETVEFHLRRASRLAPKRAP